MNISRRSPGSLSAGMSHISKQQAATALACGCALCREILAWRSGFVFLASQVKSGVTPRGNMKHEGSAKRKPCF
jgi:hypothetical protein